MAKHIRDASHSDSWYSRDPKHLSQQLSGWLQGAQSKHAKPKAIISPHAGYYYCGATAGYSFINLQKVAAKTKVIFILGPSHHFYSTSLHLSKMDEYKTPAGNLTLDKQIIGELYSTKMFDVMSRSQDEDEHSIEMQLPFIVEAMGGVNGYTIVPILVGNVSSANMSKFAKVLLPYLKMDKTFFVLSSDFCHWGKRFDFMPYTEKLSDISRHYGVQEKDLESSGKFCNKSTARIYEFIEWMDHEGMKAIQSGSEDWKKYLHKYQNTICGRNPISLFLQMLEEDKTLPYKCDFLNYAQSNNVTKPSDSSVSYAAGVFYEP